MCGEKKESFESFNKLDRYMKKVHIRRNLSQIAKHKDLKQQDDDENKVLGTCCVIT